MIGWKPKFERQSPMQPTLDERVDALERQVRALTEIVMGNKPAKDWRSTVGWARDDEGFDEMVRLGEEIRRMDREAAGVRE
jgi:hypothetical protein